METEEELFYLQDSRGYVGNAMLWWRKSSAGYTTNILEAETFTKEQAEKRHNDRITDIPWLKSYIDERTSIYVDMQNVDKKDLSASINK